MTTPLIHFLIVFDHDAGDLVRADPYDESATALAAYEEEERKLEAGDYGERRIEVVLVASDSLDTIKSTHANYFNGSVAVSEYLAGI